MSVGNTRKDEQALITAYPYYEQYLKLLRTFMEQVIAMQKPAHPLYQFCRDNRDLQNLEVDYTRYVAKALNIASLEEFTQQYPSYRVSIRRISNEFSQKPAGKVTRLTKLFDGEQEKAFQPSRWKVWLNTLHRWVHRDAKFHVFDKAIIEQKNRLSAFHEFHDLLSNVCKANVELSRAMPQCNHPPENSAMLISASQGALPMFANMPSSQQDDDYQRLRARARDDERKKLETTSPEVISGDIMQSTCVAMGADC